MDRYNQYIQWLAASNLMNTSYLLRLRRAVFAVLLLAAGPSVRAGTPPPADFQTNFIRLCDLAVPQLENEQSKGPYFVDSYAVRALCAAWDMTGREDYLKACRDWSDRTLRNQAAMSPPGAYYMHYARKPGQTNGDWYAADSSSIGMAVLATGCRCQGAERERYFNSARRFADLVLARYVKPDGGISDGLWHQSSDQWWCSSGLFASFSFLLYANTGEQKYLDGALHAVDWLNHWDLTKEQPFPLSQQGPAMIMYVMECYSAGWPYISRDQRLENDARAKVSWCFDWIAHEQQQTLADRPWSPSTGWGMKFGGLPFHQYVFSRYWPDHAQLTTDGDAEMQRLGTLVFGGKPKMTQLPMFMLMSYAERLNPGAIYKSAR